jgi:hypothetical protein
MPFYPITGSISHLSPFHGYGQDEGVDVAPPEGQVPTDKTVDDVFKPPEEPKADYMKWVSPVMSGALMGFVTYGVTRTAAVEKAKSVKVAVVMAGFTALGQVLGNWLYEKVQELKEKQQAGA